MEATPISI